MPYDKKEEILKDTIMPYGKKEETLKDTIMPRGKEVNLKGRKLEKGDQNE